MDDAELFNRRIALQVFESAGLFVFQGFSPGSLAQAMLEERPLEELKRYAHAILTQEDLENTQLVISRCMPNVVRQNLSTWKGLWNETEARVMQWKLEETSPTKRWERRTAQLLDRQKRRSTWYNPSV